MIFIPKKKTNPLQQKIFLLAKFCLTYFDTFLFCVDYFLKRYRNNFRVVIQGKKIPRRKKGKISWISRSGTLLSKIIEFIRGWKLSPIKEMINILSNQSKETFGEKRAFYFQKIHLSQYWILLSLGQTRALLHFVILVWEIIVF